jgi:hypothetical protein
MPPQFAKAAAAKKAAAKKAGPAKKAVPGKKVAAKKANPFAKSMADPACPPGSMSGGMGTSSGIGAAKKAPAKKASPRAKAMGEVGVKRLAAKNAVTAKTRANKKLPSQSRINPPITGKGGTKTTGSDVN